MSVLGTPDFVVIQFYLLTYLERLVSNFSIKLPDRAFDPLGKIKLIVKFIHVSRRKSLDRKFRRVGHRVELRVEFIFMRSQELVRERPQVCVKLLDRNVRYVQEASFRCSIP